MTALLYLLQSIQAMMILHAPVGTPLQVRLTTSVASYSTKAGTPVSAVLIAPAQMDGSTTLPAGAMLYGRVKKVTRVGLGIRHETAALELEFTRLTLPEGAATPLSVRVSQVDNGREHVNKNGLIEGVRATGSISYRVSGYIKQLLLWHFHAEVAEWLIKSFVVQVPEPEIYYPAGTELTLRLTRPLLALSPTPVEAPGTELTQDEVSSLQQTIAGMPVRTTDPDSGRSSDLTNVLLVGSRQQIEAAFQSAGWKTAAPDTIRSRIKVIRAAAEKHGYTAPMTSLLLNGVEADMSLQKGLNDASKRHHIRVWKQPGLWQGQELWMAAATRDVDYAYMRPGRKFTHEIDPNVDEERDKVAYDLAFTSCASPLAWTARNGIPRAARNGTGDRFFTDTRLVSLQMKDCAPRHPDVDDGDSGALAVRGNKWQRLVRREVLVTRSDLIRSNIYWRTYEGVRYMVEWEHDRRKRMLASETYLKSSYPTGPVSAGPAPIRLPGAAQTSLQ
jgi:hypothetical protein